jgi:hypothetical protein
LVPYLASNLPAVQPHLPGRNTSWRYSATERTGSVEGLVQTSHQWFRQSMGDRFGFNIIGGIRTAPRRPPLTARWAPSLTSFSWARRMWTPESGTIPLSTTPTLTTPAGPRGGGQRTRFFQTEPAIAAKQAEGDGIQGHLPKTNCALSLAGSFTVDESNRIQIRNGLNAVIETGVPGFIASGG